MKSVGEPRECLLRPRSYSYRGPSSGACGSGSVGPALVVWGDVNRGIVSRGTGGKESERGAAGAALSGVVPCEIFVGAATVGETAADSAAADAGAVVGWAVSVFAGADEFGIGGLIA